MNDGALTRRSLLAAGAGALSGPLLLEGGSAARALAAGGPEALELERRYAAGTVSALRLGRVRAGVSTIELDGSADLVGVQWQSPRSADIELRFRSPAGGGWGGWVGAGERGHGPETLGQGAAPLGEPIWTGGSSALELRTSAGLSGVVLHAVDVSGAQGDSGAVSASAALALPLAEPVLAAGAGQPPIIARRAWALDRCEPRVAPSYGAVELAFVHHTDNPNGYTPEQVPAMLRAMYLYHRYVRGWNDIGYNFVIDLYGRAFEARAGGIDEAVVGSQAGGYNLYSTGVAVLGTFSDRPISAQARSTLEALLAWKLSLHGAPTEGNVSVQVSPAGAVYSRFPAGAEVSLPRIAGHREADTTDCPGDALYGELAGIRTGARALAGEPVQATIALVQGSSATLPPLLAGAGVDVGERYLYGTLTLLNGTPLAGEQVAIQSRTLARRGEVVDERTVALLSTGEQGEWALPAGAATRPAQWLRALYGGSSGYGAAVSEGVHAALVEPS